MTPADTPRSHDARLLVVDALGHVSHHRRRELPHLLRAGDLVVANDAATLPAGLKGVHLPTEATIEVRLAGRRSLSPRDVRRFTAVVFGAGDYRTRTEDRPAPPALHVGDRLRLGSLHARVLAIDGHPRLVELEFEDTAATVWEGVARHGHPIQYAHVRQPLALWDVWTRIAAQPVAFEAPSAGFVLDWAMLGDFRRRRIGFVTLTHAAGISSTGDVALDRRLPFDEPYFVPPSTAPAIERARADGGRVVAVGTTVVRALEHAANASGQVSAGGGVATGRIGPDDALSVVDAIVSGMHEPGTSHYDLLRAFQRPDAIAAMSAEAEARGYRGHEFGDAVLVERDERRASYAAARNAAVAHAVSNASA